MNGITRIVASCTLVCITPFLVTHDVSRLAIKAVCVPPTDVAFNNANYTLAWKYTEVP